MGIEPTYQLVTGTLVLKSKTGGKGVVRHPPVIITKPLIISGLRDILVSVGVGTSRIFSELHGHKIGTIQKCTVESVSAE
jgi:hypothetical protein